MSVPTYERDIWRVRAIDSAEKIETSVDLLRTLGGMLPGSRQIVDAVIDLLTSSIEDWRD